MRSWIEGERLQHRARVRAEVDLDLVAGDDPAPVAGDHDVEEGAAALLHARESGQGQVVDASILDGTALLTAMVHAMRSSGGWSAPRGENLFDGGAPFYNVYETADGAYVSVAPIEPHFYAALIDGLGLNAHEGTVVGGATHHQARRHRELHVVHFECVGNDQVRRVLHFHPVRQVVVVGIAGIQEAAVPDDGEICRAAVKDAMAMKTVKSTIVPWPELV